MVCASTSTRANKWWKSVQFWCLLPLFLRGHESGVLSVSPSTPVGWLEMLSEQKSQNGPYIPQPFLPQSYQSNSIRHRSDEPVGSTCGVLGPDKQPGQDGNNNWTRIFQTSRNGQSWEKKYGSSTIEENQLMIYLILGKSNRVRLKSVERALPIPSCSRFPTWATKSYTYALQTAELEVESLKKMARDISLESVGVTHCFFGESPDFYRGWRMRNDW